MPQPINFEAAIGGALGTATEYSGSFSITGDNSVSTTVTYIIRGNPDGGSFGGGGGAGDLGFDGTDSSDFLEPLYDINFDEPVTNLTWEMFDFDQGGSWDDQIRIVAIGPNGEPVEIDFSIAAGDAITVSEERDGSDGVLQLELAADGDQDTLIISIAGPVSNVQIFYENGEGETNDTGVVDIGGFEFDDVLDDYVDGDNTANTITAGYTGDPEGDGVTGYDGETIDGGDSTGANTGNERGDEDFVRGFGGDDTIDAGQGGDNVDGGADDDVITDSGTAQAESTVSESLEWSDFGLADEADLTSGTVIDTGENNVTFTITGNEDDVNTVASNVTYETGTINNTDLDDGTNVVADNSSLEIETSGGDGDTALRLTFEKEVENIEFNISDIEDLSQVVIYAYNIDGELVPVEIYTNGSGEITAVNGTTSAPATATDTTGDGQGQTDPNGTITVKIPASPPEGPVVRLEIVHDRSDTDTSSSAINISDINFDTICDEVSANDTLDGGSGDDTISGGDGDDSLVGGQGDDDINVGSSDVATGGTGDDEFRIDSTDSGTDIDATVSGGSDGTDGNGDGTTANGNAGDIIDLSDQTGPVTVTLDSDQEDGVIDGLDADGTPDIDFDEIENLILTDSGDTFDGSVGQTGSISVDMGGGNDTVIAGQGVTVDGGDGDDIFEVIEGTGTINITGGENDVNGNLGGDNDTLDLTDAAQNLTPAELAQLRADIATIIAAQGTPDDDTGEYSSDPLPGGVLTVGGLTIDFTGIETFIVCFARGTQIMTDRGEVPIEELEEGDLVQTMDNGLQPIRWIGSTVRKAHGHLAPICIKEGTLDNARDLFVSPQHRMLVTGWRAELLTGEAEVLASAKSLVNDSTITRVEGGEVEYFHMLFDQHEIVFAEGSPSESFHPGQEGWKALDEATRDEILELFPELAGDQFENYGPTARTNIKFGDGQVLSQYLAKN